MEYFMTQGFNRDRAVFFTIFRDIATQLTRIADHYEKQDDIFEQSAELIRVAEQGIADLDNMGPPVEGDTGIDTTFDREEEPLLADPTPGLASDTMYRVKAEVARKPDAWREGQAAFNALYGLAPGLADSIRGEDIDPYHRDERLPAFYAWIEEQTNDKAEGRT